MILELFKNQSNQINQSHRTTIQRLFAFRMIALIYILILSIVSFHSSVEILYPFTHFTNWGLFISNIYFLLAAIENYTFIQNGFKQYMQELLIIRQFYHDALWQTAQISFQISFCYQFQITTIFWGYLVPQYKGPFDWFLLIYVLNFHGGIYLFIIIEEFINDIQFQRRQMIIQNIASHLPIILLFGGSYALINLSFVIITGKEIYFGISWDNFQSYFILLLIIILITLTFLFGEFIYEKYKKPEIQKVSSLQYYIKCLFSKHNFPQLIELQDYEMMTQKIN